MTPANTSGATSPATSTAGSGSPATPSDDLERQKLRLEIEKLRTDISWSRVWFTPAAVVPLMVALATLWLAYRTEFFSAVQQNLSAQRERLAYDVAKLEDKKLRIQSDLEIAQSELKRLQPSVAVSRFYQALRAVNGSIQQWNGKQSLMLSQGSTNPTAPVSDVDEPLKLLSEATEAELVTLRDSIEACTLWRVTLPPKGLSRFDNFRGLHGLSLNKIEQTDLDLSVLSRLPLTDLQLGDMPIDEKAWAAICSITGLEKLAISNSSIKDDWLSSVGRLAKLNSAVFERVNIAGYGLAHLTECRQLSFLRIDGRSITVFPTAKHNWPNPLTTIYITDTSITDYTPLRSIPSLEVLYLNQSSARDDVVNVLLSLEHLRIINLTGTAVSSKAIDDLRAARPQLTIQK